MRLFAADMETAEHVIGSETYDVVLCCGVLMYVNASIAEKVVRLMFARAARLVGLICLAPPEGERKGPECERRTGPSSMTWIR